MSDFWDDDAKPVAAKGGSFWDDDAVDPEKLKTSALDAFGNAASDTLLMGYLPQVEAGLTKAAVGAHNLFSDNEIVQPDYVKLRDETKREMDQAAAEHPTASKAGTVAGIGASLPFVASKALKGAEGLSRMQALLAAAKTGAKSGAVFGAIQNPGDVEGELSPIQAGDRLARGAAGAALGAGLGVGVEALPSVMKGVKGAGKYFDDLANEKAAKTLGHLSEFEHAVDKGTANEIGQMLRSEGAIKPWSRPESLLPKVQALKKMAGQDIGEIIGKADKGVAIDFQKMASELIDDPEVQKLANVPGMEASFSKIQTMLDSLARNKQLGLKETQTLRQGIDQGINFSRRGDAPVPEGFARSLRGKIRDTMNDVVNASDEMNGMPGADRLKGANKKFSLLSEAEDIADQQVARNAKNRSFSLTDIMGGLTGGAAGGPGGAAAIGLGMKGVRTFGNANASLLAGGASKALLAMPKMAELAGKNPAAFNQIAQRISGRLSGEGGTQPSQGISPKLLQHFSDNPELIDSLKDESLKQHIREQIKDRNPANQKPKTIDEAQDDFIQGN